MRHSRLTQVVAAVSLHGDWIKALQARVGERGPAGLLGMKARQVQGLQEGQAAQGLKEMVQSLPTPSKEVLGLLSTAEMLTRYLTLPSEDPRELHAMSLYQLEGLLPFPIQEYVTSVKVLGPMGEATRVLVAAVHRPHVERLLRICRQAGLTLSGIAASSEAIGNWHRACWWDPQHEPSVWLAAELCHEGLEIGILVQGSLVYMRQVPSTGGVGELATLLQDTIRAYERERVGPSIEQITLSGPSPILAPGSVEQLEAILELPVRRIDPLERSPFREVLSVTAQELAPEVSFSELLGAVCTPRLLGLDLLPQEARLEQVRRKWVGELRKTAVLAAATLLFVAGWVGARIGGTEWQLHQAQEQIRQLKPRLEQVKAMAASVQAVHASRKVYTHQMSALSGAVGRLLPGMSLQFLGLDAEKAVVVRGMAPDFTQVSGYAAALREDPLWEEVTLRSAKHRAGSGVEGVEFELHLDLRPEGRGPR